MLILGIDPGYAIVGYGVLHSAARRYRALQYGVIRTQSDLPLHLRLLEINQNITELIKIFKPDALAIEELFFNSNQKTALSVAEARGVIILSCTLSGLPVYEYTPLQVKQSVTGYGRADKMQIMEMTRRLLGLPSIPKPDDAADALAVALCHAQSAESKMFGL